MQSSEGVSRSGTAPPPRASSLQDCSSGAAGPLTDDAACGMSRIAKGAVPVFTPRAGSASSCSFQFSDAATDDAFSVDDSVTADGQLLHITIPLRNVAAVGAARAKASGKLRHGAPTNGVRPLSSEGDVVGSRRELHRLMALHVIWRDLMPSLIASYLRVRDLVELSKVCRATYQAMQLPSVWCNVAKHQLGFDTSAAEQLYRLHGRPPMDRAGDIDAAVGHMDQHRWQAVDAAALQQQDSSASLVSSASLPLQLEEPVAGVALINWLQREDENKLDGVAAPVGHLAAPAPMSRPPRPFKTTTTTSQCGVSNVTSSLPPTAAAQQPLPSPSYLWRGAAVSLPSPSSPIAAVSPAEEKESDPATVSAGSTAPPASATAASPLQPSLTRQRCSAETEEDSGGPINIFASLPLPSPAAYEAVRCSADSSSRRLEEDHRRVVSSAEDDILCSSSSAILLSSQTDIPPSPPDAAVSPSFAQMTLCRSTADWSLFSAPPPFPWRQFTKFIYFHQIQHSIQQLSQHTQQAWVALQSGAWEKAYGELNRVVNTLMQVGSCRTFSHLETLAQVLRRRASICTHRGHFYPIAALCDLAAAAMICPDAAVPDQLKALRARQSTPFDSAEAWLTTYAEACGDPSPLAGVSVAALAPWYFPELEFASYIAQYLFALKHLHQHLQHLLVKARDSARPGTEELLVRALVQMNSSQPHLHTAAFSLAELAVMMLPKALRLAVEEQGQRFVTQYIMLSDARAEVMSTLASAVLSNDSVVFSAGVATVWTASLAFEVLELAAVRCDAAPHFKLLLGRIALAMTPHHRADALQTLASHYTDADAVGAAVPRHPRTTPASMAMRLLRAALGLCPTHHLAAISLGQLFLRRHDLSMAKRVLSDCIHRWAQPCVGLRSREELARQRETALSSYLHRRDRSPRDCYIPVHLLLERSRFLNPMADLAEATVQHPELSHPYRVRAAMAMDMGLGAAADGELHRVMYRTMQRDDAALRLQFLSDYILMAAAEGPHPSTSSAAAVLQRQESLVNCRQRAEMLAGLLFLLQPVEESAALGNAAAAEASTGASARGSGGETEAELVEQLSFASNQNRRIDGVVSDSESTAPEAVPMTPIASRENGPKYFRAFVEDLRCGRIPLL